MNPIYLWRRLAVVALVAAVVTFGAFVITERGGLWLLTLVLYVAAIVAAVQSRPRSVWGGVL